MKLMKPIIKAPINEKLDIKYKLVVTKVDLYRGDVRVDIKFNSTLDYLIAKLKFNRNAIIRLFTGLKTPDNHVFVRKFGYFDLSNTIKIIINGPALLDDTFLTLVELIAKLAIKKLLADKSPKEDDYKLNVLAIKQPYIPRLNKTNNKPVIKLDNENQSELKTYDIENYPKADALYKAIIKQLRLQFKKLNDDELWAFGLKMRLFFKSYK